VEFGHALGRLYAVVGEFLAGRGDVEQVRAVYLRINPALVSGVAAPPREDLTTREIEYLAMISSYIDKHGYAPTYRAIAEALGVSVSRVHQQLEAMRLRGLVDWTEFHSRTIRILVAL
jgi:predicted ArsR family transcriptional regulator